MKYDKQANIVSGIIELAEVIPLPDKKSNEPFKSFGMGNSNISFQGFENLEKFNNALELLFSFNKEIEETWTLKKFENDLVSLIRRLKKENRKCTTQEIKEFFDAFTTPEVQESEILYELHGAEMHEAKIQLGEFTIYNFDLSIAELTERFPYLKNQDLYFSHRKSQYLIGIKVKARENAKSVEIANKICQTIDNVFSYMIADLNHQRTVSIFNFRGWRSTNIVVCNTKSMGFHGHNRIVLPVNISDPFFTDSSQGNDKIWNLIAKSYKSEIEKRVLTAIEWIGKSIHDIDVSKSLVQFVFAIEGMLQLNDKAIITPSIVSQLSDWLAFIISNELEERKKIAKYFKDIYQKRSAIAHGAAKTIESEDLGIALQISKLMVITFLTCKPFCDMKSIEELNKHITELKFK